MKRLRNSALVALVTLGVMVWTLGCGTLFYPHRMRSKSSGRVDVKVVVLDCLWLLIGVIPGAVALGVDFINETIYFSEDELEAEEGDEVSVNIHGPAPASCEVTLRLVDTGGQNLTVPVRAQAVAGKEIASPLSLEMPAEIETGDARLVLAVDRRDQVVWHVRPR